MIHFVLLLHDYVSYWRGYGTREYSYSSGLEHFEHECTHARRVHPELSSKTNRPTYDTNETLLHILCYLRFHLV